MKKIIEYYKDTMPEIQTVLIIKWYNPIIGKFKTCKKIIEIKNVEKFPERRTVNIIHWFDMGEWNTDDIQEIRKYSEYEDNNKPSEPNYNIYSIHTVQEYVG